MMIHVSVDDTGKPVVKKGNENMTKLTFSKYIKIFVGVSRSLQTAVNPTARSRVRPHELSRAGANLMEWKSSRVTLREKKETLLCQGTTIFKLNMFKVENKYNRNCEIKQK
jgi:hypothetical protein